jgi:hypothetical protein
VTSQVYQDELLTYEHCPALLKILYALLPKVETLYPAGVWSETSTGKLQKNIFLRISQQLKKFAAKVQHIHIELGRWAADYYMAESIQKFIDAAEAKLAITTRNYQMAITKKAQKLINFLVTCDNAQQHRIIFVEQRATVVMLNKLLTIYPTTKDLIRCGTFVGSSAYTEQKAALSE